MTTPLEAQELAKRLREVASLDHHDPTTCRALKVLALKAAAFLEHPVSTTPQLDIIAERILAGRAAEHPVNTGQGVTGEMETQGPYEARLCKDIPADCCDYGIVSLSEGREVCRVWREQDARAIAAFLAARPPLASVEGADWKLVPVEPTEAMLDAYWHQCGESKEMRARTHAYGKRYYSAMLDASPALAQSGRSSAEPVALGPLQAIKVIVDHMSQAGAWHEPTLKRVRESVETVIRDAALLSPPVGPQEAVAVSLEQQFRPMAGYDKNQPGYQYREGWNAAIRHVMDLQRASSPPNGDAP